MWKRPTTWYALVVTIAALIGHFEKVRDFVLGIVCRPSATITAVRREIHVFDQDDFEFEFEVTNASDYIQCAVHFDDVAVIPPDGSEAADVQLEHQQPRPFANLKLGASERFKISGSTKVNGGDKTLAKNGGNYVVIVNGDALAPYWFRSDRLAYPKEPRPGRPEKGLCLHVWPRRTVGVKELVAAKPGRCQIKCSFMTPDEFAKGFEAEASLTNEAGVEFEKFLPGFPGAPTGHPTKVTTERAEVAQLNWKAEDVVIRKPYEFSVFLKATDGKTHDWAKITERTKITFGSLSK
jgi:hypothetical protein